MASIGLVLSMPLVGAKELKDVQDVLFRPSDADLQDPAVLFAIKLINILVSAGKLFAGGLFLYLVSGHPVGNTGTNRRPAWVLMGLAVLAMVAASPLIDWLNAWNQELPWQSEWLQTARNWEEEAARLTTALMRPATPIEGLTTFFMVAVLAAAWEELIFRGLLQRLIEAGTRNGHVAVWSAALIFSAIHMQFFSFVPRLLLGVILGYLYLWSRNLWVPILAHFLNNAVYIIYSWFAGPEKAADTGNPMLVWAIVGLAGVVLTLALVYQYRDRDAPPPWSGLDPVTRRLPLQPGPVRDREE